MLESFLIVVCKGLIQRFLSLVRVKVVMEFSRNGVDSV